MRVESVRRSGTLLVQLAGCRKPTGNGKVESHLPSHDAVLLALVRQGDRLSVGGERADELLLDLA